MHVDISIPLCACGCGRSPKPGNRFLIGHHPRVPLSERLARNSVDVGGCRLWTGATTTGYGVLGTGGHNSPTILAHRLAWILENGPIPDDLQVMHLCDVNYPAGDFTYRRCIHVPHLALGTRTDNMRHMVDVGRQRFNCPRGERHFAHIVSEADVREIRRRYLAGENQGDLAAEYGTCKSNIQAIVTGLTWRHV